MGYDDVKYLLRFLVHNAFPSKDPLRYDKMEHISDKVDKVIPSREAKYENFQYGLDESRVSGR